MTPGHVLVLLILTVPYFIPSIVAFTRHLPNSVSLLVINLFLGWTLVGWVVALAMACRSKPAPKEVIVAQQRGGHQGPAA